MTREDRVVEGRQNGPLVPVDSLERSFLAGESTPQIPAQLVFDALLSSALSPVFAMDPWKPFPLG
jgi:hypothetical protein